jgi:hypothetical protein
MELLGGERALSSCSCFGSFGHWIMLKGYGSRSFFVLQANIGERKTYEFCSISHVGEVFEAIA